MVFDPVMGSNIAFQPRLECGVMYYEFESEPYTASKIMVTNLTRTAFEYHDYMPFVTAGAQQKEACFRYILMRLLSMIRQILW